MTGMFSWSRRPDLRSTRSPRKDTMPSRGSTSAKYTGLRSLCGLPFSPPTSWWWRPALTYGTVSTPTARETKSHHSSVTKRRSGQSMSDGNPHPEASYRAITSIPSPSIILRAAFSISSATLGTNRFGTTKWGKGFRRLRQRRLSTISLSGLVASTIATVRRGVNRGRSRPSHQFVLFVPHEQEASRLVAFDQRPDGRDDPCGRHDLRDGSWGDRDHPHVERSQLLGHPQGQHVLGCLGGAEGRSPSAVGGLDAGRGRQVYDDPIARRIVQVVVAPEVEGDPHRNCRRDEGVESEEVRGTRQGGSQ